MPAINFDGPRPRRTTSTMQIYADLRTRIVTGALRPMQCLSETELATSLGVSRTPVREAMGKLEEEGLVEIRPRFGTFVAPILPAAVRASQFVREALECTAIVDAAARCTEAQAQTLQDILGAQRAAADDRAFLLADDALHRTLMEVAGQPFAWDVVHTTKATIDRIRHLSVRRPTKRQAVLSEHEQIVDRVTAGDPDGAAGAMRAHLRGVFVSVEVSMAENPEYFAWTEAGPRANRHRPRALREAAARRDGNTSPAR